LSDVVRIYIVDPGDVVLAAFSDKAHAYARKVLESEGVNLELGKSVTQIFSNRVILSDESEILTRTVVWAGGTQASEIGSDMQRGRGGRIVTEPDLTVSDFPGVYVLGDLAAVADEDGQLYPQLGSVALQQGSWAGDNIIADIEGKSRRPFKYHDKGIMAMIGRNAAVAEMGKHRHELHGPVAFAAWLGVHAWLLSGIRQRVDAFVSWGWDYFSKNRAPSILDDADAGHIDWQDNDDEPRVDITRDSRPVGSANG
jgi:NADH dehydrogenase